MKRLSSLLITAVAVGAMAALPVYAANGHGSMQGMGQGGSMQGMEQGGSMAMNAGSQLGQEIHKSTVDGYTLTYRLIDMKELMADAKGKSGMSGQMDTSQMPSHHLMVFITAPDGKPVEDVKAGYLVKGPNGGVQKAMTMGMRGGQGANVDFPNKGAYEIKTKAIVGDQRLVDEFTYQVK